MTFSKKNHIYIGICTQIYHYLHTDMRTSAFPVKKKEISRYTYPDIPPSAYRYVHICVFTKKKRRYIDICIQMVTKLYFLWRVENTDISLSANRWTHIPVSVSRSAPKQPTTP